MAIPLAKAESSSVVFPNVNKDGSLYLRVQLPNNSTSVLQFQADMTMWEVLNVISAKKELVPSQHIVKVVLADGTEKQGEEAKSLESYVNIERLKVEQTIFPDPARATLARGRRTSIITSQPKSTNIRVTTEFPKTLTDTENLRTKLAGLKTQGEYTTKSALPKQAKSMKSLTMMLFKKGVTESSIDEMDTSSSQIDFSVSTASLTSLESNKKEQLGEPNTPRSIDSSSPNQVLGDLISSLTPGWEAGSLQSDSYLSPNRSSFAESSMQYPIGVSYENPSFINMFPESSTRPSIASFDNSVPISPIQESPDKKFFSLHERASSFGSLAKSINTNTSKESISASINELNTPTNEKRLSKTTSVDELGSSPKLSVTADSSKLSPAIAVEKQLRKRTISTPSTTANASLRRSALQKASRPQSEGGAPDSSLQLNAIDIEGGDGSHSASSLSINGVQHSVIRIRLPDDHVLTIKIPHPMTMERILSHICQKKNLDFDTHTLQISGHPTSLVEMDKPYEFYSQKNLAKEILVVKSDKMYSTMCVSQDGKDVLILRRIDERFQVMAGTIESLMERITDEQECIDMSFHDTFLLTFRSFMSPVEFYDNLIARFHCELPPNPSPEDVEYFNKMRVPTQRRVIGTILWWAQHHWHDFGLHSELKADLSDFARWLMGSKETDFYLEGKRLLDTIQKQSSKFDYMLNYFRSVERKGKTMESMLMNLGPEDLAKQLCLHDFQLFKYIHPIEVLNQIWKKKDEEDSPSLDFFIQRFDKESYWVATELVAIKDLKKRTSALKQFILTAKACLDLHNYYSVFALIAGLNLSPVQRLKKTWEALPEKVKKTFQDLEKLSDPSRNMKNYRESLAACQPPIVPFLRMMTIYLKDLTFMNDGNESKINGMINFDKLRMMANRVRDISSLASIEYKFDQNPPILNYLAKPPVEKSMTKLKQLSLECEK
ncbi:hypothetical protein HK098_004463 [Nowakowskiella sp. JEL0407]|nr:hypothetical protein HK098_004463 [Nowakowskiella sp. JEL0407]